MLSKSKKSIITNWKSRYWCWKRWGKKSKQWPPYFIWWSGVNGEDGGKKGGKIPNTEKSKGKLKVEGEMMWNLEQKEKTLKGLKKKKSLKPIRKQSKVAGNDDGTHEGENMNVISSPLSTKENVWKRLKREYTAGYLGRRKMKKIKIDYNKNGGKKMKLGNKKRGCHISLTPFLAGVSPRAATMAKYWMTRFVLTVLPAPDSPL